MRAQQHAGILQAIFAAHRGAGDQALGQGQRARGVAGIGMRAGQCGQQLRVVELIAQRSFGARQQLLRVARPALLHQQPCLTRLQFYPGGGAQLGHFRRARCDRNALQAVVGALPVAAFLREQSVGMQRFGLVAMHGEQAIHHAAGLIGAAGLLVQAGQIQTDPGIARALDHRRFQLGLRADRIAGFQRLAGARAARWNAARLARRLWHVLRQAGD